MEKGFSQSRPPSDEALEAASEEVNHRLDNEPVLPDTVDRDFPVGSASEPSYPDVVDGDFPARPAPKRIGSDVVDRTVKREMAEEAEAAEETSS